MKFFEISTVMISFSIFLFLILILFNGQPVNSTVSTTENVSTSATGANNSSPKPNSLAIKVGEGNSTVSFTQYFPSYAEINVGDSITWYNGINVPNPHTVTFVQNLNHLEKIGAPFYVSNTTEFIPVINNLGKPLLETASNGSSIIMALNANALFPTIINSTDEVLRLNKDAVVDFEGNEKYVNSGPLLSLEQTENFDYSFSGSFTLVFNKPGLYEYSCLFHPWMVGKILVNP